VSARSALRAQAGQASLMMLAVVGVLIAGGMLLFAFGNALGARGKYQRGADLAAISAAQVMRDLYPRLFEPPYLQPGVPNPRHLDGAEYRAAAVQAAMRGGRRNGVAVNPGDVGFPQADIAPAHVGLPDTDFAPTSVTVRVRGMARIERPRRAEIPVRARATAQLSPGAGSGFPGEASGAGYKGPLAYRQGKPMRPDVALAFDRMERAARAVGVLLTVTSGYRSDAEQAQLFAAHPDPKWVAPPGESLHRYATELDLGPPSAYAWLASNAPRFGFVQRYSWEPWHWGYTRGIGSSSVGFGARGGDGAATRAVQSFVPPKYAPTIIRAAQRWSVSAQLLAAQLYAESGFNPFARSPAGAEGIAQFMPGTATAMGLADPFDPDAAINAQAHLMRDLLGRFGSVPLALAAYNAGTGAVAACGCVPAIPETTAYVARILGLLGGAGDPGVGSLEVRLIE
jgi:Transglycosylase SLT domain/D-alanyl-D-alanine carboxypeptidase/Putative Flp pilus-assembly TadE/G-like